MLPGTAQDGERAVWDLDAIQAYDVADGSTVTSSGDTLFMTQGVFAP